eukprot:COSAG01_NODE_5689_length_4100_cov_5.737795_7_plen_79_part_00
MPPCAPLCCPVRRGAGGTTGQWGRSAPPCAYVVRVRVEITGLIITRTDRDFPTFSYFPAPIISTRTRSMHALTTAVYM